MVMSVKTITQPKLQSAVLKWFADEDYCFEQETALANSGSGLTPAGLFDIGLVVGRIPLGASSSAAKSGGNTGGGALTLDATTPILAGAVPGIYTARLTVAAAVIGTHSGLFEVRDPSGEVLGEVQVGNTFADQVKFAIAYATADFIVGDGFDITIAAGSGKVVPLNLAATDGSQNVAGVVMRPVNVPSAADVQVVVVERQALLLDSGLIWPSGFTAPQIAAATVQLAALGIIVRAG
jgi:hypothetical protein